MLNKIHLFILIVACCSADEKLVKRSDVDVQTCVENFDIYKDKIIRTQDSTMMGAKYLNEIDLDTREECLRLCCETDTCDVFVYEEKSSGSCYLFHCGPPEDFKCKFTGHANYSIAILTLNRHLNELENQIKLTKHEQDLTRLRKPEEQRIPEVNVRQEGTRAPPTQPPTSTTTKPAPPKEVPPDLVPSKAPVSTGRRCSRYQFECRSSGECIAIYNACDGIPQCTDGSDEAPELGCPETATAPAPAPHSPQPPLPPPDHPTLYQNELRKPLPPLLPNNVYQAPVVQPNIPVGGGGLGVAPPDTAEYVPVGVQAMRPPAPVEVGPEPVAHSQQYLGTRNWSTHQNNPVPIIPHVPQFAEQRGMFEHKGSGVQGPEGAALADRYGYRALHTTHADPRRDHALINHRGNPMQYGEMNLRNEYQKVPNYYGDIYRQQYPVPDNWPPNPVPINSETNQYNGNNENWQPVQIPQSPNVNEQANPVYRQPNTEVKPNWKSDLIDTQGEVKSYDHTIIHDKKSEEHKTEHTEATEENPKTDETAAVLKNNNNNNNNHNHKVEHIHVHLAEKLQQVPEDLQDGEAERPGGAILSLTLGVCLSCVMAILIGCRLRIVRRRMRRGGKSPYAHDADYLVNGMYL